MSRLRPLLLAALLSAPAAAHAWGVNNPSGDIQPLGGAGGGTTGSSGPAGTATGNVDWHGYTQTDSTQGGIVYAKPNWCPAGSATAPGFAFAADPNTGIYDASVGVLGLATQGVQRAAVSSAALACTVPVTSTGNFLYGPSTAAAPGLAPSADPNTGVYSPAVGSWAVATGGAQRLTVNSTALTSTVPVTAPLGSATAPSYTFAGDTTTGQYDAGSGVMNWVSAGHQAAQLKWYNNGLANPNTIALILGDAAGNGGIALTTNGYGNGTQALAVKGWANGTGLASYATLLAGNITVEAGNIAVINPVANSSVVGFQDGASGNYMAGLEYVSGGTVRLAPNNTVAPALVGVLYGGRPAATKSSAYAAVQNDAGSTIEVTASSTQTLPLSTNVGVGYVITYFAKGAVAITVAPNAADTIQMYGTSKAAGASVANTAANGATITLQLTSANSWSVIALIGSWS